MLFLVPTPIGNLADLTLRALETLKTCDLILCEDTRHSAVLLKHYHIDKPLLAYHQFNEKEREERALNELRQGRNVALISDAGSPLISDPGHPLIGACVREGLPFTALPGPCSPIAALQLSGFSLERFQFIGFLPRERGLLMQTLRLALAYRGTTAAFESPQRLAATLKAIREIDPHRHLAVVRELTKIYEECRRGSAEELLLHYEQTAPRGEIVLVFQEGELPDVEIDPVELVRLFQELHGLTLKEAIKASAKCKGLPKSEVYRLVHT